MRLRAKISMVLAALLCLPLTGLAEGVDELPAEITDKLYSPDMLDPMQPIGPSAYRDWKAPNPPPWTIATPAPMRGTRGVPASWIA